MTVIDLPAFRGIAQRSSTFVFDLLDKDLANLGTLDVDADRPATINNNINRTIKRKVSGLVFPRTQALEVNMLSDRVRISMVLGNVLYPCGVYMFADPSIARRTGGDWVDVTLVDQGLMLDQQMANTFAVAPGSSIIDAILDRLHRRLTPAISVESSSAAVGSEWVSWPVGTSDLDVINDLCQMAGFYSVYFDNNGVAVCKSVPNMATAVPDFVYASGTSVIADTIIENNDLLTAPNRYTVVNNGMSDAPIAGHWDIPSDAPHSIANRGMTINKVIDSQSVATPEQAAAMAMAEGQSDTSTYEWASFSTIIDPRHDTFNIVEWDGKKYHEQEHSFTCIEGADMRHGLRRVY